MVLIGFLGNSSVHAWVICSYGDFSHCHSAFPDTLTCWSEWNKMFIVGAAVPCFVPKWRWTPVIDFISYSWSMNCAIFRLEKILTLCQFLRKYREQLLSSSFLLYDCVHIFPPNKIFNFFSYTNHNTINSLISYIFIILFYHYFTWYTYVKMHACTKSEFKLLFTWNTCLLYWLKDREEWKNYDFWAAITEAGRAKKTVKHGDKICSGKL